MSYKGTFKPSNPSKYVGDITKIRWLSLWERAVMKWLDQNENVIRWGSEVIQIRYLCETDQKTHLYLVDFYIEFKDGKRLMVEVKPAAQTRPPTQPQHNSSLRESKSPGGRNRKNARFLKESKTYIKNVSKWKAAAAFAKKNNLTFQIWTEDFLKTNLGIRVL
jgi:hypothetical protein